MKKLLLLVLSIAILVFIVACEQGQTPEHTHSFGEWSVTKNSTCTEDGIKTRYCSCGEKQGETVPAAGHKEQILPAKESTCTDKGVTEGKICSECGEIFILQQETAPLADHVYDDNNDPECNVCGFIRIVNCKHDTPEKIEIAPSISPTCQETGLTEGMKCTLCDTMVVPQRVIEIIDCIESDWIVDLAATHFEDGVHHTECTMCGRVVNEEVLMAGQKKMVYKLLSNNTYELSGVGKCSDKNIVIPSEYNGLPVTSIGSYAFYRCTSLTSISIPDSVTSIGYQAFLGCTSLTSVDIPDSVTSIGDSAFSGCTSLTSITLPDSVTSISNYAFEGCTSLTSVEIPNSVTSISSCAFQGCTSLTSITIPDSVTSISNYAFEGCTSLTSVKIFDSVTSIGHDAFLGTSLQLNEHNNALYLGVNDNPYHVLIKAKDSKITNCEIHSETKIIAGGAFDGCRSLGYISIPDSVEIIGYRAFDDCSSLQYNTYDNAFYLGNENNPYLVLMKAKNESITSCVISDTTKFIYNTTVLIGEGTGWAVKTEAFAYCTQLTEIMIPDSVQSIGPLTFYGCTSLTSVVIGDSVTSIGERAFYECTSLTNVTIGDSVTNIGSYTFYGCTSLTSITIPDSVTTIGDSAFYGCTSLSSVEIPDSVTNIGSWAFYGCTSLSSVEIPDSVTNIGSHAFNGCTSLTSITIPDSVTVIGESAFGWCISLTEINVNDNNLYFKSVDGNLYSKDGKTLIQYAIGKNSSSFVIPDTVTQVKYMAFGNGTSLKSVTIPDSVTSIGSNAFNGCTSLTSIIIPDSVTSMDGFVFYNCTLLTIYCEAKSQPEGWDNYWNQIVWEESTYCPVVWGYTGE